MYSPQDFRITLTQHAIERLIEYDLGMGHFVKEMHTASLHSNVVSKSNYHSFPAYAQKKYDSTIESNTWRTKKILWIESIQCILILTADLENGITVMREEFSKDKTDKASNLYTEYQTDLDLTHLPDGCFLTIKNFSNRALVYKGGVYLCAMRRTYQNTLTFPWEIITIKIYPTSLTDAGFILNVNLNNNRFYYRAEIRSMLDDSVGTGTTDTDMLKTSKFK